MRYFILWGKMGKTEVCIASGESLNHLDYNRLYPDFDGEVVVVEYILDGTKLSRI